MLKSETYINLRYIPIAICVLLPTTFVVTLAIALHLEHVDGVPYISDTGTYVPESCIFGQCLNIIAAFMCFLAFVRYSQIKEYAAVYKFSDSLLIWNVLGVILGIASSFGMSLVANFQETNVLSVHIVGAILCFGGATVYFWIQTICTYYLVPTICSMRLVVIRVIISIFCTAFFISGMVTASLSKKSYQGTNPRKWKQEDGGWEYHVISVCSEWIATLVMSLYILTFAKDLNNCRLHSTKIVFHSPSRRKLQVHSEMQNTENYSSKIVVNNN